MFATSPLPALKSQAQSATSSRGTGTKPLPGRGGRRASWRPRASGHEVVRDLHRLRAAAGNGNATRGRSRCRAPSPRRRLPAPFQAFRKAFPSVQGVRALERGQPQVAADVRRRRRRAASYYNVAAQDCRGCTLVAADVLDQSGVTRYLRTLHALREGLAAALGPAQLLRRQPQALDRHARGAAHGARRGVADRDRRRRRVRQVVPALGVARGLRARSTCSRWRTPTEPPRAACARGSRGSTRTRGSGTLRARASTPG